MNINIALKVCLDELNKSNLIKYVTIHNESRVIKIISNLASKRNRSDLKEILYFAGLSY